MNAWRRRLTTAALCLIAATAYAAGTFHLSSPDFHAGGRIPMSAVYTGCGGGNTSPKLVWSDPPAAARSYAVTIFDRDAPGGFWHWIAFDIDRGARGLSAGAGSPHSGSAPRSMVQLRNDFGNRGYSGPCPPPGKPHHYVVTVYALDVPTLGLVAPFSRSDALHAIHGHTLAKATLVGTFGR